MAETQSPPQIETQNILTPAAKIVDNSTDRLQVPAGNQSDVLKAPTTIHNLETGKLPPVEDDLQTGEFTPLPPTTTLEAIANPPIVETPEQARARKVTEIIHADKSAYEKWIQETPEDQRTLQNIPADVLRFIAIPARILELAEDPAQVRVIVKNQKEGEVWAYVVEHKSQPVTDPAQLQERVDFWNDLEVQEATAKAQNRYFSKIGRMPKPPEGMDQYHINHINMVADGILDANDFVTNELWLTTEAARKSVLHVKNYFDRPQNRRKGVARSFYNRLREVAKNLGFRFITGEHKENNTPFFVDKLGRQRLSRIKNKQFFVDSPQDLDNQNYFTVDFLYPQDKAPFVA
ncbi:MAG: hypothetical protein ACEQSA_00080 [Weeksellaceae bacterium]